MRSNQLLTGLPQVPLGDCSRNCSCSILKLQQVPTGRFSKLLNLREKVHRVLTGDPMCPRRSSWLRRDCLFSTTCNESSCARLVEVCGFQLNLGAPANYEIIYILGIRTPNSYS
jgi:hypothetical protein